MGSKYKTKNLNGVEVPLTPAEIAECEAGEAAHNAQVPVMNLNRVRIDRAPLLAETDVVAARFSKAGMPFHPEWVAYTKALRDVTKQLASQSDPSKVFWPVKPAMPDGV